MKLYRKLLLFTLAAALVPLSAVGFVVLRRAERALVAQAAAEQGAAARAAAGQVERDLLSVMERADATVRAFSPARLSAAELRGLPRLLYHQLPEVEAVAILDRSGRPVAPVAASTEERPVAGRPPLPEPALAAFLDRVHAPDALGAGGWTLASSPGARPAAVVARAVEGPGEPWVLALLLGLGRVEARLAAASGEGGAAALLDDEGTPVAAAAGAALGPEDRRAAIRLARAGGGSASYRDGSGAEHDGAWAAVEETPWGVFLKRDAAESRAQASALRRGALAASGAALAAFLGLSWVFVRRITSGLGGIESAARRLGSGDLGVRLPEEGSDEIAEVSRAFNRMGAELGAARARLERWNEELQAEVEARTRDLREAQAQLLESQKLAAIGQLGAGVAHEINNPLTGILGQAQLLLERRGDGDPDAPAFRRIEELARRSRDITHNLLRFSQQRAEPDFAPLDVNRVVRDTLTFAGGQMREAGVTLEVALAEGLPAVLGDAGHLAQVLLHLLSNSRTACAGRPGSRIVVSTRREGTDVLLEVTDDGKGIAPEVLPRIFEPFFTTKEVWSNVGLGLSVSYRIVSEHGGRLRVRSSPGEGATFTVVLPAQAAAV